MDQKQKQKTKRQRMDAAKRHKEEQINLAEQELKQVKSEIRTDKLKKTATTAAATAITSGVVSLFGSGKLKELEQANEKLSMEKLLAVIGFTKDMIDRLLTKKEALRCSGKIYSEEYRRKFETKNDIFRVEKNLTDCNKLVLTINGQSISDWFKEQWEKLRQSMRPVVLEEKKSRGFRM